MWTYPSAEPRIGTPKFSPAFVTGPTVVPFISFCTGACCVSGRDKSRMDMTVSVKNRS